MRRDAGSLDLISGCHGGLVSLKVFLVCFLYCHVPFKKVLRLLKFLSFKKRVEGHCF